ncbi:DUF2599 domain-containing protein [Oerskovia flava]|uniref:DUF2599 domain-containing protein n=1 Tax=Oerskovia flava TaxID=2986422 RepID=UPI00223F2190|nr:DUF2599 domain-containing protein [Oerskovia sp. JB1-3-2]
MPLDPRRRILATPVLAACALALLGGCGLLPDDGADPGPAASSGAGSPTDDDTSTGTGTDPAESAGRTTVTLDDVELVIRLPEESVSTDVQDDGSVVLELAVPDSAPVAVEVGSPAGATVQVHPDRSVTLLDETLDEAVVGGLAPLSGGTVEATGDAGVDLVPWDESTTLRTRLGTDAVVSAEWRDGQAEGEGGRSLAVDPTSWARGAGDAGIDAIWSRLVALEPEADSSTMADQLRCHALGAPDKATWNLEPWRPDVGLVAVLAARCNPA